MTRAPTEPPSPPRHAPYATGMAPFTIGLKPIAGALWMEIDDRRAEDVALKRRLFAEKAEVYWAAEAGSEPAQEEVRRLVEAQLAMAGAPALEDAPNLPPLLRAAFQVQEDLLIMAQGPEGGDAPFRLVAAALFFPSSWSLAEKFGRPIAEIHGPVPGFGTGTRNAQIVDRIFAAMRPGPVLERFGWSVYPDATLSLPRGEAERTARSLDEETAAILATPHIRVERQTIRRLPETGALLFTVRIHVDPLERIVAQPDGPRRAAALADSLEGLSEAAIAFKNLTQVRPALLKRLRAIAAEAPTASAGSVEGEG